MMRRLCKKRLASQFTTAEGRAELNVNVCALLTDTNLRNYCLLQRRLQLQSMSIITIVALLVFLTIPEGESNLLKNKLFLQFLPACTHSLICVPVSGLAFCNQQHALLCLCPDSDILFRPLTTSGSSLGDQTLLLRCQCITKEKKPIGRYIGQVEVIPASSHCNEIEIM